MSNPAAAATTTTLRSRRRRHDQVLQMEQQEARAERERRQQTKVMQRVSRNASSILYTFYMIVAVVAILGIGGTILYLRPDLVIPMKPPPTIRILGFYSLTIDPRPQLPIALFGRSGSWSIATPKNLAARQQLDRRREQERSLSNNRNQMVSYHILGASDMKRRFAVTGPYCRGRQRDVGVDKELPATAVVGQALRGSGSSDSSKHSSRGASAPPEALLLRIKQDILLWCQVVGSTSKGQQEAVHGFVDFPRLQLHRPLPLLVGPSTDFLYLVRQPNYPENEAEILPAVVLFGQTFDTEVRRRVARQMLDWSWSRYDAAVATTIEGPTTTNPDDNYQQARARHFETVVRDVIPKKSIRWIDAVCDREVLRPWQTTLIGSYCKKDDIDASDLGDGTLEEVCCDLYLTTKA